jgi:tape measure domain-containing protein
MTITVQEAEVTFSASGMTRVQSLSHAAGKSLDKVAGSARLAGRALAKAGRQGAGGLKSVAGAAGAALKSLGAMAASGAATGALALAGGGFAASAAMVKLASDAETLNTQFKVLTGSQESATKLMQEIDQFAAATPFQKMDIADAARQLLAFGGSADTAVDELRMLGDISAATGQPIGELSELYGKARVQGRLFGEDINQLTGRGIPITQALAKEFGVAESEVKGLVSEGKVGFPEMQRALASMTGPGGQFTGMMEELSGTTAGKFSTLVDRVKQLGAEFGESLLPMANAALDTLNDGIGYAKGFAGAFSEGVTMAKSFAGTVVDGLQDGMVVAGVFVDNYKTAFAGLFKDVVSYAKSAFNWILENSRELIGNIIEMAKNAPSILENTGRALGEEVAFQLGMSDEKLKIDPMAGVRLKPLTEFKAPEASKESKQFFADIDKALEKDRAARRSEDTPEESNTTEVATAAAAAAQAFVSKSKTVTANKDKAKDAAGQRGSAASVFNRLQESLVSKQNEIAKKQLSTQEDIKEASQQAASTLNSAFGGGALGLAAVLG